MKKMFLGILSLCMAFSLVACNDKVDDNINQNDVEQENINQELNNNEEINQGESDEENNSGEVIAKKDDLNFKFLKLENEEKNKIYSPLSIKYALKMLERGAVGESKEQISKAIGDIELTKYESNKNMSLANSLFIRDTFESEIKESYINALKNDYDAEVIFDSFVSPNNINSWISDKTLNLINNLVENVDDIEFMLINALGIDMEWANKFLDGYWDGCHYEHENFWWSAVDQVTSNEFGQEKQEISGMEIKASLNNYDIVEELGEENIRKIVGEEYRKWLKELASDSEEVEYLNNDLSDENIEKEVNEYLDGAGESWDRGYIAEIDSNYGRVDYSTDFSLHVDDNIKVFAKDLKEYNGTTLQYVGIMPINESLDTYISNINDETIDGIIANLKDLKSENFKEGVVTKITGYIPKFKFEYELNFKEDLKQLGITNVFEEGKANLTEICNNDGIFITDARHKANIEFTQDGIKAAAATMLGGGGAGGWFDYCFDIPVEEIDLTFDKPYMFLIRDKETGEIWFVGTVYEPLLWENEPEKDLQGVV